MISLAIKYRPETFDEVVEQSATKVILQQQLDKHEVKNAYLFCGGAGTGKTTCARIFANEINNHKGIPIELDAASNNSVDDVRDIIQQAKTTSLDSEYKIFILDEVHALSNQAWQAMLKVLEEPPLKTVFIMCTTDPQKIPKTILSRVQRYDFQRISATKIYDRLSYILKEETCQAEIEENTEALKYIAKLANGGMRDAITMLDKCLAYSEELTIDNVLKALGIANYTLLCGFLVALGKDDTVKMIDIVNQVYMSGYDLKLFIKGLTDFVLDYSKWYLRVENYCACPLTDDVIKAFEEYKKCREDEYPELLDSLIKLQTEIKWDTNPKSRLEAWCITGE